MEGVKMRLYLGSLARLNDLVGDNTKSLIAAHED